MIKWLNILELESRRGDWTRHPHAFYNIDRIYSFLDEGLDEQQFQLATTGGAVMIKARRVNGAWMFALEE